MASSRRKFIRNTALAAGGVIAAPYILPSGRLFASSGNQLAEHVVYVMFGGGVRQQESVLQRYLEDSQPGTDGVNPGNILYNMLDGEAPFQKIVYGTTTELPGDTPIPKVLDNTLQSQGTLFKEVQAQTAGHYNGFVSLLQGNTISTQGLRQKPIHPTIFEYVRRHMGVPASKVWFVGNGLGNSTPLLNHSTSETYGVRYGANMFIPPTTFGAPGRNSFNNGKVWHPEEELPHIIKMKYFLDQYYKNVGGVLDDIENTEDEKYDIKNFMKQQYALGASTNVMSATEAILRRYKPTLLALNMTGVDVCHGNFTSYLSAMHSADHQIGNLWNIIQSIPEMAGKTAMIICPEHGRNLNPNPILDQNGWKGYDHSDANSRRIFSLMVGAGVPNAADQGSEGNPKGLSADCVPTIAHLLGIKSEVMSAGYLAGGAQSFLDQIS